MTIVRAQEKLLFSNFVGVYIIARAKSQPIINITIFQTAVETIENIEKCCQAQYRKSLAIWVHLY